MSYPAFQLTVAEVLHALGRSGDSDTRSRVRDEDTNGITPNPAHPQTVPFADQPLVAALQRGDEAALESLFRQYYADLHAVATIVSGSSASADEVVNDVFTALWGIREKWNPVYGIRAYLVRAARNRARSVLRTEDVRRRAEQSSSDMQSILRETPTAPDAHLDADELARTVWNVVNSLSDTARIILALRWRHELSWEAIAHAVGLSVGAAQMHHNRACKLLRQRLPRYLK